MIICVTGNPCTGTHRFTRELKERDLRVGDDAPRPGDAAPDVFVTDAERICDVARTWPDAGIVIAHTRCDRDLALARARADGVDDDAFARMWEVADAAYERFCAQYRTGALPRNIVGSMDVDTSAHACVEDDVHRMLALRQAHARVKHVIRNCADVGVIVRAGDDRIEVMLSSGISDQVAVDVAALDVIISSMPAMSENGFATLLYEWLSLPDDAWAAPAAVPMRD